MGELNPPFALQNAGATHTAQGDRLMVSGMFAGANVAGGLVSRGGVNMAHGGLMAVAQQNTPNMSVQVFSGIAYVPGSESTFQGVYTCVNDGAKTLTVAAADATYTRIDSVIARVYDSQYSGATNAWALEIVTGTPSAAPVAPALPVNSLLLGDINVTAGKTSIITSDIIDRRRYAAATGAIISCTSSTKPVLNTVHEGQGIWLRDTGELQFKYNNAWVTKSASSTSQSGSNNVSFTSKASHTYNVTFPTAFASKPKVMTNINTAAGVTAGWGSRAYNISTTGFTMFVFSDDGVTQTWNNLEVQWFASL